MRARSVAAGHLPTGIATCKPTGGDPFLRIYPPYRRSTAYSPPRQSWIFQTARISASLRPIGRRFSMAPWSFQARPLPRKERFQETREGDGKRIPNPGHGFVLDRPSFNFNTQHLFIYLLCSTCSFLRWDRPGQAVFSRGSIVLRPFTSAPVADPKVVVPTSMVVSLPAKAGGTSTRESEDTLVGARPCVSKDTTTRDPIATTNEGDAEVPPLGVAIGGSCLEADPRDPIAGRDLPQPSSSKGPSG
ncbi:hypothetical protein Taro_030382 [Colocasia esculenta]|uniref:Uncharacterized protein n=1 Tax=Colocasia esculenta TaxID=4460 RepID=A0A843VXR3_COLES|nr:hypothetical protein [Colocasia esculenta]